MGRRKPIPESPDPGLRAAERRWFELKLWANDRPPFVAGMSAVERRALRAVCRELAEALDLLLGKE